MKVAIIGYGVVGKATHKTIQRQHEVMIHDPLQGLNSVYTQADVVFICTPTEYVNIYLEKLTKHPYVYVRSTIPFTLVKNKTFAVYPEFLTERYADYDTLNPKCSIVGGTPEQFNMLTKVSIHNNFHYTTAEYAALAKLSTNCYFSQKVTFANILYNLCQDHGLDYNKLKNTMAADERMWIHDHWDVPGHDGKLGYGGKCFPKNIEIMKNLVNETDELYFEQLEDYNNIQRDKDVGKGNNTKS